MNIQTTTKPIYYTKWPQQVFIVYIKEDSTTSSKLQVPQKSINSTSILQVCQHISVTATTSRSSTKEVAQRRSTTRGRMDLSRGPILHPGIKHINLYPYFLVSTCAKLFTYLQLSYIRKNNSTVTFVIFNYLLHEPQTLNTFSQLHNVPKKLEKKL